MSEVAVRVRSRPGDGPICDSGAAMYARTTEFMISWILHVTPPRPSLARSDCWTIFTALLSSFWLSPIDIYEQPLGRNLVRQRLAGGSTPMAMLCLPSYNCKYVCRKFHTALADGMDVRLK